MVSGPDQAPDGGVAVMIELGRVLAGTNCHDSPLLAPALGLLDDLGPLPDDITVHLDVGYDSGKTRTTLGERGLRGRIAIFASTSASLAAAPSRNPATGRPCGGRPPAARRPPPA